MWGKVLRVLVHSSFCVVAKARMRMYVRGLEHVRNLPGTIVMCSHQSQYDVVAFVSALVAASRFRGPLGRISIVATEMLFEPGVLGAIGVRRPLWLCRLVSLIDLDPIMRGMRWYPIPMADRRFLRSHLRDILGLVGNLPLKAVFRESPEWAFPSVPPETALESVICWEHRGALYRREPFSVFRPEIEEVLRQRHRLRIADNLALFASVLDRGEAILIAPGGLSRDGQVGNVKSGVLQILQQTQREAIVLPLSLMFDFMTTGRMRTFLAFGPPLVGVREFDRRRYEAEVPRTLAAMSTITFGQVAARAMLRHASDGRYELREHDLKLEIQTEARSLAKRALNVDSLLVEGRGFESRWRRFLAYCRREGLLEVRDGLLRIVPERLPGPAWSSRIQGHPWEFSSKELDSIIAATEGT